MSNYGYVKKNKNVKGIVIAAFVCLICLSAIAVGVTSLSRRNNRNERETEDVVDLNNVRKNNTNSNENSKTSGEETTGNAQEKNTSSKNNSSNTEKNTLNTAENSNSNIDASDNVAANGQAATVTDEPDNRINTESNEQNNAQNSDNSTDTSDTSDTSDLVADVSALVATYAFNESDILEWPVMGNVILDYSMDSTIYFPTLDSYRCNPAIVIQSENGTSVFAGVNGVVEEISTNDEIGKYVVVGIGSGYEVTYGQLENIAVSVGTVVEPGTAIGVVGEVTRYYKNEGPNVYYEVTKDGVPCDPLDYLR